MSRKLTVTRLREIRMGWSYRNFDFLLTLNDVLYGTIKDGQCVSFVIPEDELLLEVRPRTHHRRPSWCAIIPAGTHDYGVTVSPWEHKEPVVEQIPAAPVNYLSIMPCPTYLDDTDVDFVEGLDDCFSVQPEANLAQIVDRWLDGQIEPTNGYDSWNRSPRRLTLILTDAGQVKRSTNGKDALLQRCLEHWIKLMLDLGDGYYQNLTTGKFFALKVGETWVGNGDVPYTYGRLEWEIISSIPPKNCEKDTCVDHKERNG